MVLVDGSPISRRRRYSYRGHFIVQTYRSHDVRNATHNGFDWHVEWATGGAAYPGGRANRANAKALIDYAISTQKHEPHP